MKRLAVVANCGKTRAADVLRRIARRSRDLGLELVADPGTARLLECPNVLPAEQLADHADAVLALGGDGTVLRVVRDLNGRDCPVIGVNIGGLGFMTSVAEGDLDCALECLAGDQCIASVRAVAEVSVIRDGAETAQYRALNEVLVTTGHAARVMTLHVTVDGESVTSYVCDGLIVSTPTGSTGHSLSAGGPILTPETPAFVVSLVCPHTLSWRPLVLPDSSIIGITTGPGERSRISVDGQVGQDLAPGDAVSVRRSARSVRFLHLPGYCYFAVLQQKLHWSGSNV